MAVQWDSGIRNAILEAWKTELAASFIIRIYSGAMPANVGTAASGTLLVEWTADATPIGSAAGGVISLNDLPLSVAATAGAPTNAGYYRIYLSNGTTCKEQGTITVTGGGGDMTLDNISIAAGQIVNVTAFSKTAPGA
jgi:hypothetical protein